jgi:hypothetical protein
MFQRAVIVLTLVVSPLLSLSGRAETLHFAWPDGASAKVQARAEGRRVMRSEKITWDMTSDFTMRVRRAGDRVVVSRHDFSGWKGTFPPSFGGGAERFIDMVPSFTVSADGQFQGIEGTETARKLMYQSVGQSGGLDAMSRSAFETITSDASLKSMTSDHWSVLNRLWTDVELDPEAVYELRNVTAVPQLGGGEIEITGTVQFVKETPCASGRSDRRCVHMRAETGADKAQVGKIIQSLIKQAGAERPAVTAWDQRFKVDIVMDKATMLPQQLTLTRIHSMDISVRGESGTASEEMTKTYTFTWLLPEAEGKK